MAKRKRVQVKSSSSRKDAARDFAEKKRLQRRRALRMRAMIAGVVVSVIVVGAQLFRWHQDGFLAQIAGMPHMLWHEALAGAGLRVDQVHIHGRRYTTKSALEVALAAPQGSSILMLDLPKIRAALEKIPEVQHAHIHRDLPNVLHVYLSERIPAVIWQNDGKQVLVDRDGVVLDAAKYNSKQTLVVMVGADAPAHVRELLQIIASEKSLTARVRAAVRVGARRWNVQLAQGVTVMLPETGALAAWQRFAGMVKNQALLTHRISTIDMRLHDRVFVTPIHAPQTPVIFSSAEQT